VLPTLVLYQYRYSPSPSFFLYSYVPFVLTLLLRRRGSFHSHSLPFAIHLTHSHSFSFLFSSFLSRVCLPGRLPACRIHFLLPCHRPVLPRPHPPPPIPPPPKSSPNLSTITWFPFLSYSPRLPALVPSSVTAVGVLHPSTLIFFLSTITLTIFVRSR